MISVIMPVYNSEMFLEKAIRSVLNQTEQNLELIIINDGSTDKSEEIILSFDDSRIRYFSQHNQGVASARNMGLELAQGEFIAFQDADDISLPIRLERLKDGFISEHIGIVHSDVLLIDENEASIGYWLAHDIDHLRLLRFFIKIGSPLSGATMMVRRAAMIDLRYDVSLSIGEDNNMIYQVLKSWGAVHVPEPLYFYRKHSSNTTKTKVNHLHLTKLINAHSLEQLVPEIDWGQNNHNHSENEIVACAIIASFLFRRGVIGEAEQLLNNTLLASKDTSVQFLVIGLTQLVLGKYDNALEILLNYGDRDHIVENYTGEAFAFIGDFEKAKEYFMKALSLKPDYTEPMDNLKSIGGIRGMNIIDRSWTKFKA